MNEQKQINQFVGTGQTKNRIRKAQPEKNEPIQGILTSRIEKREKNNETYYYGFFKLKNQEQEIPVVFREKPPLAQGSELRLEGA
jgi:hypothetical protein